MLKERQAAVNMDDVEGKLWSTQRGLVAGNVIESDKQGAQTEDKILVLSPVHNKNPFVLVIFQFESLTADFRSLAAKMLIGCSHSIVNAP